MITELCVTIVFSYLLGSVPFGLLLTKYSGKGDIRTIGSGNIGATNVLRTGSKKLALLTLLLDAGKGAVAVYVVDIMFGSPLTELAGLVVVLAHMFPIWLKGNGGKGVATALAVIAVLVWPLAIMCCVAWLAVFFLARISSLAAIISMIVAIVGVWLVGGKVLLILTVSLIATLVILRHHANIRRLIKGRELKFKAR
jgi:glycerol-3-phosphate acyltransferase PlsY